MTARNRRKGKACCRGWSRSGPLSDPRQRHKTLFFEEKLGDVSELQRAYRKGAGELVVAASGAHAGTIGGATDWLLRFLVSPDPDLHLAMIGAALISPAMIQATTELAELVSARVGIGRADSSGQEGEVAPSSAADCLLHPVGDAPSFDGPAPGSATEFPLLARACWALALLTEVYRAGPRVLAYGPLARFAPGFGNGLAAEAEVSVDQLLALAPEEAINELTVFRSVLTESLLPRLASRQGAWRLGPTFAGSALVGGADADLIASGLLVELKTNLGSKRKDGTRSCVLDKLAIFQLVAYALLDLANRYSITRLALFNARFAYFADWSLDELIGQLSNGTLEIATARREFAAVLGNAVSDA